MFSVPSALPSQVFDAARGQFTGQWQWLWRSRLSRRRDAVAVRPQRLASRASRRRLPGTRPPLHVRCAHDAAWCAVELKICKHISLLDFNNTEPLFF